MTQEEVAETGAFARAFDQTRDVGDHEALFGTDAHHAEMRMQGREGVVGDLGTGVAHGRDEGGLARVGHAQQTDVGKHLELKTQGAVLTGFAGRALTRRTVHARFEVQIAQAALAACGQKLTVAVVRQIGHGFARGLVDDERAHGHAQHDVFAARAEAVGAAAVFAVGREELARVSVVHQRVDVAVGLSPHTAAAAAVAAVGTALGNEFFAAKARCAIAAFAALNFNAGFVNEFHRCNLRMKRRAPSPC